MNQEGVFHVNDQYFISSSSMVSVRRYLRITWSTASRPIAVLWVKYVKNATGFVTANDARGWMVSHRNLDPYRAGFDGACIVDMSEEHSEGVCYVEEEPVPEDMVYRITLQQYREGRPLRNKMYLREPAGTQIQSWSFEPTDAASFASYEEAEEIMQVVKDGLPVARNSAEVVFSLKIEAVPHESGSQAIICNQNAEATF